MNCWLALCVLNKYPSPLQKEPEHRGAGRKCRKEKWSIGGVGAGSHRAGGGQETDDRGDGKLWVSLGSVALPGLTAATILSFSEGKIQPPQAGWAQEGPLSLLFL